MSTYLIKPIGSLHTGWAIIRDGVIWATHPSPLYLGAYLDATLRGAEPNEAHLISEAIVARPEPTYEERMAQFRNTGPWKPALDPFQGMTGPWRYPPGTLRALKAVFGPQYVICRPIAPHPSG